MNSAVISLLAAVTLLPGSNLKEPKIPVGTLIPGARLVNPPSAEAPYGYLWKYHVNDKGETVREITPYVPREGDWLFFDDMSPLWTKLYAIANTAPPFHAGIVVKKPNGEFAVLESGPDDTLHVYVLDIMPRLFTFKGILQVRQVKRALTPAESAKLTSFAMAQEGKRYAMWRLLLQGTPLKTKGGPFRCFCAHTLFNRRRWLCAEITVTGSAIAGLTDPKKVCGSNTYPLDIIDNKTHPELANVYEDYTYWAPHK